MPAEVGSQRPHKGWGDFVNGKLSASLPENSYLPGLTSSKLDEVLPPFIYDSLAEGFKAFGKKNARTK